VILGLTRFVIALDASRLCGARIERGFAGARLGACAVTLLAPGALTPSAAERNVARASDLRDALADVRTRLDIPASRRVDLLLPGGTAHPLLVEAQKGALGPDELRFRLAATLPFPVHEAVLGRMSVGPNRSIAAALHRSIIEEYEALLSSADLPPRRVELSSFVAFRGLLRQPLPEGGVDVVLGDTCVSFGVWDQHGLAYLRTRLRAESADDAARVFADVERTAAAAGRGSLRGMRAVGRGAPALVRHAAERGHAATLAWSSPLPQSRTEAAELAWLGGVLA
jgi:hypothetical protein